MKADLLLSLFEGNNQFVITSARCVDGKLYLITGTGGSCTYISDLLDYQLEPLSPERNVNTVCFKRSPSPTVLETAPDQARMQNAGRTAAYVSFITRDTEDQTDATQSAAGTENDTAPIVVTPLDGVQEKTESSGVDWKTCNHAWVYHSYSRVCSLCHTMEFSIDFSFILH